MFEPKAVIFPSSDNDSEILVTGSVGGKARNVTVTDEALGQQFRALIELRNAAVKTANDKFDADHAMLSENAFAAAVIQFEKNAPKDEE